MFLLIYNNILSNSSEYGLQPIRGTAISTLNATLPAYLHNVTRKYIEADSRASKAFEEMSSRWKLFGHFWQYLCQVVEILQVQ